MSLARVRQRLAQAIQARTDAAADLRYRVGTVTHIDTTSGVTTDGASLLTVDVRGSTQQMSRLARYSAPTVGDLVAVLIVDKSPIVLDKIIGIPA